jgi:hypothetical protein
MDESISVAAKRGLCHASLRGSKVSHVINDLGKLSSPALEVHTVFSQGPCFRGVFLHLKVCGGSGKATMTLAQCAPTTRHQQGGFLLRVQSLRNNSSYQTFWKTNSAVSMHAAAPT